MRTRCWPTHSTASCCPQDHGFPLRALAPGWVGSTSIKWLGRIVVSSQRLWTRNNTSSYTLIGADYPPEGEAPGKVATTQTIKSALALPWPAQFSARRIPRLRLRALAGRPDCQSGVEPRRRRNLAQRGDDSAADTVFVGRVSLSLWEAQPGEHTIMTRATDAAGNSQPDEIPFNEKGYLFNQPLPHPIRVA